MTKAPVPRRSPNPRLSPHPGGVPGYALPLFLPCTHWLPIHTDSNIYSRKVTFTNRWMYHVSIYIPYSTDWLLALGNLCYMVYMCYLPCLYPYAVFGYTVCIQPREFRHSMHGWYPCIQDICMKWTGTALFGQFGVLVLYLAGFKAAECHHNLLCAHALIGLMLA